MQMAGRGSGAEAVQEPGRAGEGWTSSIQGSDLRSKSREAQAVIEGDWVLVRCVSALSRAATDTRQIVLAAKSSPRGRHGLC